MTQRSRGSLRRDHRSTTVPEPHRGLITRSMMATLEVADGFAGGGGDEAGHGANGNVAADEADGTVAHASVHAGGMKCVRLTVIGAIDGGVARANVRCRAGNATMQAVLVGFIAPTGAAPDLEGRRFLPADDI